MPSSSPHCSPPLIYISFRFYHPHVHHVLELSFDQKTIMFTFQPFSAAPLPCLDVIVDWCASKPQRHCGISVQPWIGKRTNDWLRKSPNRLNESMYLSEMKNGGISQPGKFVSFQGNKTSYNQQQHPNNCTKKNRHKKRWENSFSLQT